MLLGCAAEPATADGPTTLHGVRGSFGPWSATATQVTLLTDVAHAEDVVAKRDDAVPLTISARQSEWDLKAQTALFYDDVRVVRAGVVLTAARLTVQYRDSSHVDTVTATGGVTVTQAERVARAQTATLTAKDGRIVLTGAPTLTEGINELSGTRIEVFLDDERATCAGSGEAPCSLRIIGGL